MLRRLAPAIVLFATLAPPLASAQVNIDQDKTPAHIFSSDCAVCHKSTRGLANGRGSAALTAYLAEHYTSSRQEAAAMAAYVLAGGGGTGTPAAVREEKPQPDRTRSAKPEEEPGAAGKPPAASASGERSKPARVERSASAEPGRTAAETKPPVERREPGTVGAAGRPHVGPKPATPAAAKPEPTTVATAPRPAEPASPPANAVPQETEPAEAPPAPTDDIPD